MENIFDSGWLFNAQKWSNNYTFEELGRFFENTWW